ncbi:MAG: HEAT repeat domain-containing protein [Vicinamibacterales bacterium]|nr:HEAT repeat domain-containing protein [Vicinamibacterales bacterium]
MRRSLLATIVTAAALAAGACASLPPGAAAVVPLTYEAKVGAILRLEQQRLLRLPDTELPPPLLTAPGERAAVAPPPPPDLIGLTRDTEARVRRRAAMAIGRVGLAEGIAPLVDLLAADPEPDVRKIAAFALGLIGDRSAAEPLMAALEDGDARVQGRAAEALGLIGHAPAASAIAAMMRTYVEAGVLTAIVPDDLGHPKPPDVEAVRLGAYALVRLRDAAALRGALVDAAGQPVSDWWPVAYAFQRIEHPSVAPVLLRLLESEGQLTRAFAARGLGRLKAEGASAPLLALVPDVRVPQAVRVQAIRALAEIGTRGAEAPLLALIVARDTPWALRLEATAAIGRVGSAGVVEVLLDLVTDGGPAMRAAVIDAIARLDADAFLAALSGLGPDPHFSVRAAIAGALARLPAETATPRLEVLAGDEDQRVVPAALSGLAAVRAPGAADRLTAALEADDAVVRKAAAEGLATLGAGAAVPALEAAFERARGEGTYVARAAILAALVTLDPGGATARLAGVLANDRDWAMRMRAADLLRARDADADLSAMRPAPWTAPTAGALAAMVSPPYAPQAYIETDKGTIQIDLAVLDAPWTVANFIALAGRGYFNGVSLHRVVPDFVVQDGDPRGDGEGGPGYTIRDELNERPYLRGTAGMALDWKDTGGSQFFITHSPQPHLDARYTVFGHVIAGMDVVDALEPWDVIRQVRVWDGAVWIGTP